MKRGVDESANGAKRSKQDVVTRSINTIRILGAEQPEAARSGHPGAPMGCAPIAYVYFREMMKYNPANPSWMGRDRFVLSNGHACALQYAMLHLCGYDLSIDDLKQFRQADSRTPGHPENFATPGVEVSTGPLGQGLSNAVGMAIAEAHLAAHFNREGFPVVDNYTYVICGDGCLQEGVTSEACSLAGHLGLGKLILVYDDNSITIDGDTSLSFTEDVVRRYEAYGWHTQVVPDYDDLDGLRAAIAAAKEETARPSIIKYRTVIGFGSAKEGTEAVHGAPLGAADIASVKASYGFDPEESWVVPADVAEHFAECRAAGAAAEAEWTTMFEAYAAAHPELAAEFQRRVARALPDGWREALPRFTPADKPQGTRKYSGMCLNAVAPLMPELMGGSADLTPSNSTALKGVEDFQRATRAGRYMRFGIREHAMSSVMNGMFAYGMLRPFGGTFLNFIGYALGGVRVTALSRFGVLYVATHDSIGLGEDGPTHQPVEMLESLRSMPNMNVLRPADGNETSGCYMIALEATATPSVMVLSRQDCPHLEGTSPEAVLRGAYVLGEYGDGDLDFILASTGSEVQLAVEVAKAMPGKTRVVSMPCMELFDQQPLEYRMEVFPDGVVCMSIEAAGTSGWAKYSHAAFGMQSYGVSGKAADLFVKFGFTVENLVERAAQVKQHYEGAAVLSRLNVPAFEIITSAH